MKRKLITHTDMDGVSCAILGKIFFTQMDIAYCGYNNVNEEVLASINQGYKTLYITDISVNKEVADILQDKINKNELTVWLIDHHKTAEWLNEYSFASVHTERRIGLNAGTYSFYQLLKSFFPDHLATPFLDTYVELVRRYDSWEWFNVYNDKKAKSLNDLFTILGKDRFIQNILEKYTSTKLTKGAFEFSDIDNLLLEIEFQKRKKYICTKEKSLILMEINNMNVGIVFAENYISELGNYIVSNNKNIDLVAIIGANTVSYRATKENIDVSMFAELFGGGGHTHAAGSPIQEKQKIDYIKNLFDIKE